MAYKVRLLYFEMNISQSQQNEQLDIMNTQVSKQNNPPHVQ